VPLKEDHRDITNLTYNKIGIIKKLILEALINNRYNNYTKSEVKQIVQDAITRGVISISDLSPKLVETEKLK
jgi:adenine-specific DNA methylase